MNTILQAGRNELTKRHKLGVFTNRAEGLNEAAKLAHDLQDLHFISDNDTEKLKQVLFGEVNNLIPQYRKPVIRVCY